MGKQKSKVIVQFDGTGDKVETHELYVRNIVKHVGYYRGVVMFCGLEYGVYSKNSVDWNLDLF